MCVTSNSTLSMAGTSSAVRGKESWALEYQSVCIWLGRGCERCAALTLSIFALHRLWEPGQPPHLPLILGMTDDHWLRDRERGQIGVFEGCHSSQCWRNTTCTLPPAQQTWPKLDQRKIERNCLNIKCGIHPAIARIFLFLLSKCLLHYTIYLIYSFVTSCMCAVACIHNF